MERAPFPIAPVKVLQLTLSGLDRSLWPERRVSHAWITWGETRGSILSQRNKFLDEEGLDAFQAHTVDVIGSLAVRL